MLKYKYLAQAADSYVLFLIKVKSLIVNSVTGAPAFMFLMIQYCTYLSYKFL